MFTCVAPLRLKPTERETLQHDRQQAPAASPRAARMGLPVDSPDTHSDVLQCEQPGEDEGEGRHDACTRTPPPPPDIRKRRKSKKRFGLREAAEGDDWTLFWTDCSVSLDRVKDMKRYQKINHFPGMSEICRKDLLARNMNRMLKLFPKDYNIFPRTWCLPADYSDFQAYTRAKKSKTYICKPDSGCQGKGIFITRSSRDVPPGEHMICQVYVSRPLVIDGYKFDLRIYVLVTSCDPLSIFMFQEGLARFCTTQYNEPTHGNVEDVCMHLTNYSINKHSENFVRDEDTGSKRKLSTLNKHLESVSFDTEKMWCDIEDVIIKTLISAHPVLKHNYHTCFPNHTAGSACFEILGFDVLLDQRLRPWVLEVNHSPSFTTDSPLDREVKDALLYDALVLINLGACDRRKITKEERRRHVVHSHSTQQQQRLIRTTVDQRSLNESSCLHHGAELRRTISAQRIHWPVGGSQFVPQDDWSSSCSDARSRPAVPLLHPVPKRGLRSHDPAAALQSLLVISSLVRRPPGFSHVVRDSSLSRGPRHGKGQ
ncbi:hypothetical protein F2P81_022688 [Scophthalmus maximus]|uniref:Tubulin polyglutamylase TTLL6 n=1 Tax=Scophthalmus maximus TaxID=52904 RepID=A0A6A4RYU8_SCOMX|nr:hypothetical protein F2P81_022688 [Scophthalmus maximus]